MFRALAAAQALRGNFLLDKREYCSILIFKYYDVLMREGERVEQLLADEQLVRAAEVLKSVSHPARLRIIELLEEGERSVTEIQDYLGITQSLTSQHLNNMKARGVLQSRKNGNMVYYSVRNPDVIKVIRCIRNSNPVEQKV